VLPSGQGSRRRHTALASTARDCSRTFARGRTSRTFFNTMRPQPKSAMETMRGSALLSRCDSFVKSLHSSTAMRTPHDHSALQRATISAAEGRSAAERKHVSTNLNIEADTRGRKTSKIGMASPGGRDKSIRQ